MKIVCISDSHGAENAFEDVIYKHEADADLFLFLGDGYSEFESIKMRHPKIRLYGVKGNCDSICRLQTIGEELMGSKRILYTHGHLFSVKMGLGALKAHAKTIGADLVFFGHTHCQTSVEEDGIFYINPGSVREGRYAVVEVFRDEIRCNMERI